jgi:hypothetical protein
MLISGFRREVDENCNLLGYYAPSSGNFLQTFQGTFRSHLKGSRIIASMKMGPIGRPETSLRNYHYLLHNNPEERSS